METRRPRKLLLHKWQIVKMTTRTNERGLAIIPTKLFFERGYAKLEIGIGRGKKLWDKRDSIADRDRERDARREVFAGNDPIPNVCMRTMKTLLLLRHGKAEGHSPTGDKGRRLTPKGERDAALVGERVAARLGGPD